MQQGSKAIPANLFVFQLRCRPPSVSIGSEKDCTLVIRSENFASQRLIAFEYRFMGESEPIPPASRNNDLFRSNGIQETL